MKNNKNQSYEKIYTNINNSCKILNSNVISGLENVIICLSKIESIDSEYKEKLNVVKGAYYDIQDVSSNLNSRLYDTDYENIKNFYHAIQRINFNYACSISGIYTESCRYWGIYKISSNGKYTNCFGILSCVY